MFICVGNVVLTRPCDTEGATGGLWTQGRHNSPLSAGWGWEGDLRAPDSCILIPTPYLTSYMHTITFLPCPPSLNISDFIYSQSSVLSLISLGVLTMLFELSLWILYQIINSLSIKLMILGWCIFLSYLYCWLLYLIKCSQLKWLCCQIMHHTSKL